MIHLMIAFCAAKRAVCGAYVTDPSNSTTDIEAATCPNCRAIVRQIGKAYQLVVRRSTERPSRPSAEGARGVLEELGDDGRWALFDLRAWCKEPEGQYSVMLRVRASSGRRETDVKNGGRDSDG